MGLETATYISDLVSTNPTASDPKSQGDDHLRLLKSTLQATFPNVSGPVTPTHTELNYVDGVTSSIQTQLDAKGAIAGETWTGAHDFTGGTIIVPTAGSGDADTSAASTAFVDTYFAKKASPAFTGTPTAPTAAGGTNTTQIATTAFVIQQAFSTALPVQSGNGSKFLTTDGTSASWLTAQWVEISHVTASGTSVAFTGIATTYHDLLLIMENVTLSSGASASQFAVGDATPTYATLTSITGTGSATLGGMILLSNVSNDYGAALVLADEVSLGSSPVMASATWTPLHWRVTGGVRALKVTNAGSFSGGTIRLMGR